MKLALPSYKDGKYIRNKLKIFYEANLSNPCTPRNQEHELKRALIRLFDFFRLPIPKVEWYESFGLGSNVLGQCSFEGTINLLTPYKHPKGFDYWLNTFYHEIGHYVLWFDWEKKAREFASKMVSRR